ncbi:2Fe-2S iron-sulfur cluster-binding protein [Streptomyces sp. V3I7]|uniref:2Fe-2S iron-sulfur cluster-binding protein n=1 Tax=Streptomyces sp. V3I7 TaxID=3042278 RepID=UPI00277F5CE4|nr:2Fe-2S iron-sulfur cluster-binding protein [Streptomyces sp. V3I7]MDQ0991182.1 aerobic-type carbon monoxide dehydrogenase small subunit (CoxS/CutS family) [Streptomyces sp. V3I7]
MTEDQHGEGTPQGGGRWDPLPQGDYDDGATAFVKLPEGGIDALLAADSPLAAPGHGYVPPRIAVTPQTDAGSGAGLPESWTTPAGGAQWGDPGALPQEADTGDRFTYDPATGRQWAYQEPVAYEEQAAPGHETPGQDVTGHWSIPVAQGDLPDESGEFTTSSLVEQWGGTPPATLPGGAAAPWAPQATGQGQPWGHDPHDTHGAGHALPPEARAAEYAAPEADVPAYEPHDAAAHLAASGYAPAPAEAYAGMPAEHGADAPEEPAHDAHDGGHPAHEPHEAHQLHESHEVYEPEEAPEPAEVYEPEEAPEPAEFAEPEAAAESTESAEPAEAPEDADGPEEAPEGAAEPPAEHDEPVDAEAGPEGAEEAATAAEGPDAPAEPGSGSAPLYDDQPLASYVLSVNGTDRPVTDAWIGESLLYVLRERLGLAGAKDGCSQGECGACNVQVDGRLVASCLVPAVTAAGSEVRTVEGLATDGRPSDVQRALARCGAVQCGFCVPGMAMTLHDLLGGNPAPSELETRQALCGNLCRCSGYRGVLDAVKDVVAERKAVAAAEAEAAADAYETRIPHQAGPGAGGVNPAAFDPPDHTASETHAQPHAQPYDESYEDGYDETYDGSYGGEQHYDPTYGQSHGQSHDQSYGQDGGQA